MSDNSTQLAAEIRAALDAQRVARTADVKQAEILNEQPPTDPVACAHWQLKRDTAEQDYTDGLLGKATLSQKEQAFLSGEVARFLRASAR